MNPICFLLVSVLAVVCTNVSWAQNVFVYSNFPDGFTGQGYSFGSGGLTSQGGITFTAMFSDNIVLDPIAANQPITQIYFTVTNRNATGATARSHLRFYADDNGGNAPGTYLTGYDFNPLNFGGNTTNSFFFTPSTPLIIPSNARIWAGWLLDNGGGATATPTLLQNFGVSIFSTYTAGSSTDDYFLSPAPGSGTYDSSNPPGSLSSASPSGSFGWRFQIAAVPEPTTWAMIGAAVLVGAYAIRQATRRRRAQLDQLVE